MGLFIDMMMMMMIVNLKENGVVHSMWLYGLPFPTFKRPTYLDHCSTELSIYVVEIIGPFLCAED